MDITKLGVLSAQPGDILWINLQGDISVAAAREFASNLMTIIPKGVIPLVTFDNIVANARVASVDDIRHYRNSLDEMISSWQLNDEYDEGA